jgi:type II secretory pathway pseudopilin PulG
MKKAFTLIEVNLAMLIMAGGILSIVGLYAFGFRENRQSREDVAATALADSVMSPLVMALAATNVTWSSFRKLKNYPSDYGWADYFESDGIVHNDPQSKAQSVFTKVMGEIRYEGTYEGDKSFPSAAMSGTGMSCGLVVLHDEDSAIVRIAFRAVKSDMPGLLLGMPLFFTEVRFQGLPDK